jgi:hypothetical protein
LDVPSYAVSDSAGVRIVVNERTSWGPDEGWSLSIEPMLEIGVVEGDPRFQFARILGVSGLSDGRIVVLDGGSAELRFFDAAGTYLGRVGGPGQGPGEFSRPAELLRTDGDTLIVSASANYEASWFDSQGEFVRRDRLDNGKLGQIGRIWGCPHRPPLLPDATFLACVEEGVKRDHHPEVPRVSHLLVRVPYDISWADTVGTLYGFDPRLKLGARSTVVTAGGDPLRIYVGDPAFFEIDVYGDRGGRVASIRYPNGLRPIGQAERSAYAAYEEQHPLPPLPPSLNIGEFFAPTLPGFNNLHYDPEGNIWAVEYAPPWEDASGALIFSASGELLGRVELPSGFAIHEIGTDNVLGVWRNDLGVEFVRNYALLRT